MGSALSYDSEHATFVIGDVVCEGHYLFVVLPSKNPFEAFVNHHGESIQLRVAQDNHHDDLANGEPVLYAGTVDFVAGALTKWNNHSGHYKPEAVHRDQAPTAFLSEFFQVVQNDGSPAPFLNDGSPA
jgi:hypothetical protein